MITHALSTLVGFTNKNNVNSPVSKANLYTKHDCDLYTWILILQLNISIAHFNQSQVISTQNGGIRHILSTLAGYICL